MRANIIIAYLSACEDLEKIKSSISGTFNNSHSVGIIAQHNIQPTLRDGDVIEGVVVDIDTYKNADFKQNPTHFISQLKNQYLNKPVLLISEQFAKNEIDNQLFWFKTGVDDLCSVTNGPIGYMIFAERFKNAFNRYKNKQASRNQEDVIEVGHLRINPDFYSVSYDNHKIEKLTVSEIQILTYLASNPDIVKSRAQITQEINLDSAHERTVDAHIKRLKRKIDPAKTLQLIEGVYGQGYRLNSQNARKPFAPTCKVLPEPSI